MSGVDGALRVRDGHDGVDKAVDIGDAEAAAVEAEAQAQAARERVDHLRRVAEQNGAAAARRRRRLLRRLRTATAALVLMLLVSSALLVVTGYLLWQHQRVSQDRQRAADYQSAARQGVLALFTIHFDHADDAVKAIMDASTGEFHDDFQKGAADFATVARDSRVLSEGAVDAIAVRSITGESAEVLVAGTSRVSNAAGAASEPRRWRLAVTVTRAGDRAKMSKVEFVP